MSKWIRHVIFWAFAYVFWTYMKHGYNIIADSWVEGFVHLWAYVSTYYLLTCIQIPILFDKGKWFLFALSLISSTIVILVIWYYTMILISSLINVHPTTIPQSSGMYFLEGIQMFVPGFILLTSESYESSQAEKTRLHTLEKDNLLNELNYLKAQLNPQFLFNTLNNLKTYVNEKSPKAPEMILRLSEVLDYVLYRSQKDVIRLQEEINVIKAYLELEKLRIGERLNITFNNRGDMSVMISPLILLSIIENTFKEYFINRYEKTDIEIGICSDDEKIECLVTICYPDPTVSHIDGLAEIGRKLSLSYPNRHVLLQKKGENTFSTSLTLQLGV
ncbi:MAG: histidine kinase [Saprospiraceae bacterium]